MISRVRRILMFITGLPALVAISYAIYLTAHFDHSYHAPDPVSGHTVEVAIRGYGVFYITPAQWDAVAPIWHVFVVFFGLLFSLLIAFTVRDGYAAFMKVWRSDS